MILVIDNYDSFVYNLARHMELAGWRYDVVRNDKITTAEIAARQPEAIVISPGPCTPREAGICIETVRRLGPTIPILGVCLGHQCIGEAYGAQTIRADKPVHGKASTIRHSGDELFAGIPENFRAGRYHSLVLNMDGVPPLQVIAKTPEGQIMAVKHEIFPTYGVQFHPESVLTENGMQIIGNFTALALAWNNRGTVGGMTVIWHNGTFKNEEPIFSFNDRLRIGDGVFDTMLAIDGNLVHPHLHFERLVRHAGVLGIPVQIKEAAFGRNVAALFERNNFQKGRFVINTLVSRGPAERGLQTPEQPDVQIAIRVTRAPKEFPDLHAIIPKSTRRNEGSPLSQIKSVNYGVMVMALQEADKTGANEAVLLNNKGYVTCATSSNIFAIKNKKLYTPPLSDGVLDGIIRKIMFSRYKVIEKSLKREHLFASEGVYLTNSIKGAQPLKTLDGKKLPEPSIKIERDFHLS